MKQRMLTIAMLAAALLLSAATAGKESAKSLPPIWCPPYCSK